MRPHSSFWKDRKGGEVAKREPFFYLLPFSSIKRKLFFQSSVFLSLLLNLTGQQVLTYFHRNTHNMRHFASLAIFFALATAIVSGQKKDSAICRKPNGFYEHEDYCDYYYECVDGVAYIQECPNGLAYSGPGRGLVDKCDYAHRVGCPDTDTGKIMGQPPRGSGNCPYLFGIFPHDKSCTRYWMCWNGTGTVQMCPFSLLYNEQAHACDWPEKVPGCQQHPLCKTEPNGVKAIQGSCVRYWLCMGGYPRLQRCPAGLAFNQDTMRCDWANYVAGCEPAPLPEDEEEDLQAPARRGPNRRVTASEKEATPN